GIAIAEVHVPREARMAGIRRGRPEIRRRRVREIIRIDARVITPAINNAQQLFATRQAPVAVTTQAFVVDVLYELFRIAAARCMAAATSFLTGIAVRAVAVV